MKSKVKHIIETLIIILLTFIFYETFVFIKYYDEDGIYIYNSEDLIIKNYISFKINNNDCAFISKYVDNKIIFSEIKKVSSNEIKTIMNKCPGIFNDDLLFLNSVIDNKVVNYEESKFLFFSIRYFYIIDKNYILKNIEINKYNSKEANLLKDKILLD
mgnify:CR=1 FL=1